MIVQRPRRKNPATVAASPVTSLETALTQLPPELVVAVAGNPVDTLAEVAGKNATSAARSAILLVIAPRVADPTVEVMEATKGVTEAEAEADTEADVKAVRPAIPAVDMDTCHATAPKDRNATTVSSDNCHDHSGTDTPS